MKTVITGRRTAAISLARSLARSLRRTNGRGHSRGFSTDTVDGLNHLQKLLPR